jgi:hypothetical protein
MLAPQLNAMLDLLKQFGGLYGWYLVVGLAVAWLAHRMRKRAAAEAQAITNAACAAEVEVLLRRSR